MGRVHFNQFLGCICFVCVQFLGCWIFVLECDVEEGGRRWKKERKNYVFYGELFVLFVLLVAVIEEEIDMGLKFAN